MQFPKRRVSTPKNTGRWKESENPVTLCSIPFNYFHPQISEINDIFNCVKQVYFSPVTHKKTLLISIRAYNSLRLTK
jgi:hypothetical protein